MRIDVQKILFAGPNSTRKAFFLDLQAFGAVEFTAGTSSQFALSPTAARVSSAFNQNDIEQIINALRYLRRFDQSGKSGVDESKAPSKELNQDILSRALLLVDEVKKHQSDLMELEKLDQLLKDERKEAEPFGSFDFASLASLAKRSDRHLQFWTCAPSRLPDSIPQEMIEIERSPALFAGISLAKEPLALTPFRQVNLTRSSSDIDQKSAEIQSQKRSVNQTLMKTKSFTGLLERALEIALDAKARSEAETGADRHLDDRLFFARGFVAKDRLSALSALIESSSIYMQLTQLDEGELAPTHLVNRGWGRIGQDLTEVYDTPSSHDRDPSSWILWSFAIFFAMIIGDAGYGLLFLAGSLLAHRHLSSEGHLVKRMVKLSSLLAIFCIGWGVLSSAFFALPIGPQNPLRKISLITYLAQRKAHYHYARKDDVFAKWSLDYPQTAKMTEGVSILKSAMGKEGASPSMLSKFSDQIMMELALFIGIIHICTSLLRYLRRNWPALGWSLFLIGGYALVPKIFGAVCTLQYCFGIEPHIAHQLGQYLMIAGGVLAIGAAFAQQGSMGILEVMNVIQIGADVLSYLRIYALGLSGAIMANTINEGAAAAGVILAPFLLIFGHGINLLLGLMGGVIHGLRLNFLEWYHYSFEGGGRPHKPLNFLRDTR